MVGISNLGVNYLLLVFVIVPLPMNSNRENHPKKSFLRFEFTEL